MSIKDTVIRAAAAGAWANAGADAAMSAAAARITVSLMDINVSECFG